MPDPGGRGTIRVEVPADRRDVRCLDDEAIDALVAIARRVERHFGSHQDIEWAIARTNEPADNLFVVQSRPVTALPKESNQTPAGASAMSLVMGTFGADATKSGS